MMHVITVAMVMLLWILGLMSSVYMLVGWLGVCLVGGLVGCPSFAVLKFLAS
jgi:hypothetical protein